jgi:hypothetical protein
LLKDLLRDHSLVGHGLEQRLMELFHRALLVHFVEAPGVAIETAVEQEVLQHLQQVFSAQAVEGVAGKFGVLDVFHLISH